MYIKGAAFSSKGLRVQYHPTELWHLLSKVLCVVFVISTVVLNDTKL